MVFDKLFYVIGHSFATIVYSEIATCMALPRVFLISIGELGGKNVHISSLQFNQKRYYVQLLQEILVARQVSEEYGCVWGERGRRCMERKATLLLRDILPVNFMEVHGCFLILPVGVDTGSTIDRLL